ncbi:MAG: TolC family protein [Chryseotalea sp. WA131a]|jgi:outer membrane protein|nr:MAG: TolC family protein [Chryseotalea sp. WA131a]
MKRFYRLVIFTISWGAVTSSYSQEQASASFTLEQCIEYALKNSINAQNAEIDQQIAIARVRETVGLGLPQVSGSVAIQHNEQLRRFFGRYSTSTTGFSFFPPTSGANDGDILAQQSPFQLQSSGDAGITINQLIFSGNYLVGLQASKAYKDLSFKTANQTREQIVEQVTKAYYSVLINRERTDLFDSNLARFDSLLRNTIALNKNGFAEGIDVDRIRVAYNNLKSERDKFSKLNSLSTELLKFQMNYPIDKPIDIIGKIEEVKIDSDLVNYRDGWDYKQRPDYKILEANQRLQQLNIKNQYAGALPTISGFANLGYFTQSNGIGGIFTTNTNVKDNGSIGPDKWYGYSLFGVTLSMNIFTGFQRQFKIQQEKLTLQKIDNGFKSLKQGIDLQTKQASISFENAITSLNSQSENMELASNIARITKIKYEQGVGSNLEVVDAENSLRQAQTNYYSALFDAMVAKVDLDKAFGKLLPQQK